VPSVGSRGKAPGGNLGTKPPEADDIFVKICYFEPVLRRTHDYVNQFNMKWKKNEVGDRKSGGASNNAGN